MSDLALLCVSHSHEEKKPCCVDKAVDILEVMKYFRKAETVRIWESSALVWTVAYMRLSMVLMQSVLYLCNSEAAFCPFRVGINCCVYVQIEIVRAHTNLLVSILFCVQPFLFPWRVWWCFCNGSLRADPNMRNSWRRRREAEWYWWHWPWR